MGIKCVVEHFVCNGAFLLVAINLLLSILSNFFIDIAVLFKIFLIYSGMLSLLPKVDVTINYIPAPLLREYIPIK